MFSNKPYLIRAFYEWIIDNSCTPFLVVNANHPQLHNNRKSIWQKHVENGEITLNVSPGAVRDLKITNEMIEFQASFSGIVNTISVPIKSVLAIYAQENHQGMFFDYEEITDNEQNNYPEIAPKATQKNESIAPSAAERKAHLKLVPTD